MGFHINTAVNAQHDNYYVPYTTLISVLWCFMKTANKTLMEFLRHQWYEKVLQSYKEEAMAISFDNDKNADWIQPKCDLIFNFVNSALK